MIMEITDLYQPCPCGSGKKFKFCCRDKERERESAENRPALRVLSEPEDFDAEFSDTVPVGDMEESRRLCTKGLKLMQKNKFKEAIPLFREAHNAAPFVYTSANNWALCLLITGQLGEAIRVQRESLEASPLPNPFGTANLAAFLLIEGLEKEADHYLNEALKMKMPSADSCIKVCEVLARFKHHKDILNVADKSDYGDNPGVCFFTGVAAANLGQKRRAETDLRRVSIGHHKADMAQRYLRHLQDKSAPHTVLGDWPYLLSYEICPLDIIKVQLKEDENGWFHRRIAVQFCEAMLNETADDPQIAINMLGLAKHPDFTSLLWALVKGSLGPDSLRIRALSILQERGEVLPNQKIDILLDGERRSTTMQGGRLNPDFRFGCKLPPALDKIYTKAIKACSKPNPDWNKIGEICQRIMREAPGHYPANFNYAVSLMYRDRPAEAEPILRDLVTQHPEYLFAPATLLQILLQDGRDEEAEALVQSVKTPEETHPAAMANWMVAQMLYHEGREELKEARHCFDLAHQIAPNHPMVKSRLRAYK